MNRRGRRAAFSGAKSWGEAKFWLDPEIELAQNYGLTPSRVQAARRLIEEHEDDVRTAWRDHFER